MFGDFIGNRWLLDRLEASLHRGRSSHAYLFSGPEGIGKREAALRCAAVALGLRAETAPSPHPDFLAVGLEGEGDALKRTISIDEVRRIRRFLSMTPVIAPRKVVCIDGADAFTAEAANALLKSLEEPPGDAVFFLIAHDMSRVLPTIRSRTIPIRFSPVPDAEIASALIARGASAEQAEEIVELADGCPGRALRLFHDTTLRERIRRRRGAIVWLLSRTNLERLGYVARASQTDPEGLRALPLLWLSALRRELGNRKDAVPMIRALYAAERLMTTTAAHPALALEAALVGRSL